MLIIELLLVIIIIGVIVWLVNSYIPMPPAIKSILNVVVFILLLIYILQFFGLISPIISFPQLFK